MTPPDFEWKSFANALVHGRMDGLAYTTITRCERCYSPHLQIIHFEQEAPKNYHGDIIIGRIFGYQCLECGAIEFDMCITVIPSWIWHPLREGELEVFKSTENIVKEEILARGYISENKNEESRPVAATPASAERISFNSTELLLIAHDEWKRREERRGIHEENTWVVGWITGFGTTAEYAKEMLAKIRKGAKLRRQQEQP